MKRKAILALTEKTYLTKEAKLQLRLLKKKLKKSMGQILIDLIQEEYDKR